MWRTQQGENMARISIRELQALGINLATEAETRRKLGGYNADAAVILFLNQSLLAAVHEIIALRQDVDKLKRRQA